MSITQTGYFVIIFLKLGPLLELGARKHCLRCLSGIGMESMILTPRKMATGRRGIQGFPSLETEVPGKALEALLTMISFTGHREE